MMKVLVLTDGKFETKEITNELEELQKIVGGYIEVPFLSETLRKSGVDVIINEEGKFIEGLRPEIAIMDRETNQVLDVVMGNCIFASHDEEGETIPLNEEQQNVVMRELRMICMLTYGEETFVTKVLYV